MGPDREMRRLQGLINLPLPNYHWEPPELRWLACQNCHRDMGPLGNAAQRNARMGWWYLIFKIQWSKPPEWVCFLVPTFVHPPPPKEKLFLVLSRACSLTSVYCPEVNFWLEGRRFCGFCSLTRRVQDWRVIRHAVGVGLRNAGHDISGCRWVCTGEMCSSHLKPACSKVGGFTWLPRLENQQ